MVNEVKAANLSDCQLERLEAALKDFEFQMGLLKEQIDKCNELDEAISYFESLSILILNLQIILNTITDKRLTNMISGRLSGINTRVELLIQSAFARFNVYEPGQLSVSVVCEGLEADLLRQTLALNSYVRREG